MSEMKITKETIIRTIILAIALTNQILTSTGKNPLPFAEETIYEFITLGATICAAACAWWKNNSFTKEALTADEYLKELRSVNKGNE